jgi:uncharacterized protein
MTGTYRWADHRIFEGADRRSGPVLFDVNQASLFALDGPTLEVLPRWRAQEVLDVREVTTQDREALEALRDARVLVPAASQDQPAHAPVHPRDIPLGTLVLEVAQACNLSCSYCYAGGGSYGAQPRLMDPRLAQRAARFLVQSSKDRERVTLVLFGGEPLLNFPAMKAAVLEAEAAAAEAHKTLVVSFTTNGTRFTPEVVDFVREHRVGVTVSIDGPPDIHDANRPYSGENGRGSYVDVVDGLALLRAHGAKPPAARVTLTPDKWSRIADVFEHVLGLGFIEVGIAPVSPMRSDLLPTPEQNEALFAGFSRLAERFMKNATQGRVLPFSNLIDLLARLHAGRVKPAPCGAGLGYLALDAAGRFFLCHRLAGRDAFLAGSLDTGIDHAKIAASLAAQAAPRQGACSTCWARSLCAGGCHHDNHVREVELGLTPGGSCDFIRRWLELGIRVFADLCCEPNKAVLAALAARGEG